MNFLSNFSEKSGMGHFDPPSSFNIDKFIDRTFVFLPSVGRIFVRDCWKVYVV